MLQTGELWASRLRARQAATAAAVVAVAGAGVSTGTQPHGQRAHSPQQSVRRASWLLASKERKGENGRKGEKRGKVRQSDKRCVRVFFVFVFFFCPISQHLSFFLLFPFLDD